ncbi:MAG TPA: TolC family outer membrane protein [Piscinibacter sp.]|jgi:outer membrane protein|uniref:TolC family outer membrane protein n=1 Tax=Piscinibacter sp. TaxID=1903157 RepID=UPI001B70CCA1|nr:TolC family outer membrane protein [Piscinibacter sp.]MBK7533232.1 TolC family outer membrane protein [Piscinibacter sp.]MBP6542145.1 TolC family outer membrane protein [Piscinibacter sp.]HOY33594.1 TolC family outer membrane protein [Piscinibacter sp.]HPG78391.1 TolC family outer membrane protein [Piscinibacter sp.]HPM65494.1 TolC family outer membrane protein [Piscinibacter sp.]
MSVERSRLPFAPAALALALGLVFTGGARAQSLQDLYEAARGYDATFQAARALLDSAQYRTEQAKALNRPSVGLQVAATRSSSDTPYSSTLNSDTNSVSAGISGSQSLFNRANSATIDQADKSLSVSRAEFEAAEQDLIVRVAQAYFDVLAAQDTLGTTRSNKTFISEQLASAKRNFEVGTATITDTREAQARFDLATAQEIAAENDLRTKSIALDVLVGRSNVTPKGLAVPVVLPPVLPPSVDEWVLRADAEHPTVRRAALGLDVARLETEKARAGNLPTVALNGSIGKGRVSSSGDLAAPPFSFNSSGNSTNTSIGVTLNMPLFAGYAIQNRIKETLALEEKSRNDLDAARRGVAQGTRQAFYGVQSGLAQVKALEAAESSSQLALEATQLGYKVGVRVNLDVLNAQTQLFSTKRDLAKARYDVLLGSLRLRQAAGQLKPEDVAALNQLLAR